jgi:hypothetical protein
MIDICSRFPVTKEEYEILEEKLGRLAQDVAWKLIKKNSRNNHTEDQEDICQEVRISMLRAASYTKRQIYIEKSIELCEKYAEDRFMKKIVKELKTLWKDRTRHGANRQKFGPHQEKILDNLVKTIVPRKERPSKKENLSVDSKFKTYCKAIMWNSQKAMGKKITREKTIRSGQVSLSEYDYLGSH